MKNNRFCIYIQVLRVRIYRHMHPIRKKYVLKDITYYYLKRGKNNKIKNIHLVKLWIPNLANIFNWKLELSIKY